MTIFSDSAMIALLNRSLIGGAVILLILILRLVMKRFPKKYLCLLWLIPFARLLFSISIPAPVSLVPLNPEPIVKAQTEHALIYILDTGIAMFDNPVNETSLPWMQPEGLTSVDPAQVYLFVIKHLWAAGVLLFVSVNLFRYFRLKAKLSTAVLSDEPSCYYTDQLSMPMVMGIVRPKIYLPSFLEGEEYQGERELILAHEKAHKARHDHLTKLAAFAALAIHWFNPLVWAAYLFYCKDVEMACDERVMERLGEEEKKNYSLALLHFEERRSALLIPLAFGESNTKSRIKNILNYKKPGFWAIVAALVLLIGAAVVFLTDRQEGGTNSIGVIGGADGPTSIFLAGKLGGADSDGGFEQKEIRMETAAEMALEAQKKKPYGIAVELDLVSAEKISFHGAFGYLSFQLETAENKREARLSRAFTLEEAGPIVMQGDGYTEVLGGPGFAMVVPNIYNPDGGEKMYWYMEETGEVLLLSEGAAPGEESASQAGGENRPEGTVPKGSMIDATTPEGSMVDAPEDGEKRPQLEKLVREQYGSSLLYGPVAIPEYNSVKYGFLAADGENLEDIWYGVWHFREELVEEPITRIPLFS